MSQSVKYFFLLIFAINSINFSYANVGNCGQRKVQTQALIVSGFQTAPGEFPWHVALYHVQGIRKNYACGGTLVNDYQVVTAAHCVVDQNRGSALFPEVLLVQLGAYDLTVTSAHATEQKAHKIQVHENYDHSSHRNDIAIITLQSKITLSSHIQPACIWDGDAEDLAKMKASGVAVGWGITETDETSSTLRAATMPIVGFNDCFASNREVFGTFLTSNNFCAGYQNGTTVCNGDSGGGLFVKKANIWYLLGIVSFSALRDYGKPYCSTNDYGVFVSVHKFSSWLDRYLLTSANRYDADPQNDEVDSKKSLDKCKEYNKRGIAATTKQRFYVSKIELHKKNQHISDGHFISENFVIAPANEVYNPRPNVAKKSRIKAVQKYDILQITFHPEFIHGNLDNDVALVQLTSNAEFGTMTKIACLHPRPAYNHEHLLSDPQVAPFANNICRNRLMRSKSYKKIEPNTKICTNICAPRELYVKTDKSDVTKLVGLLSYCEENGDGEGIYMKISSVLPWIESIVWG